MYFIYQYILKSLFIPVSKTTFKRLEYSNIDSALRRNKNWTSLERSLGVETCLHDTSSTAVQRSVLCSLVCDGSSERSPLFFLGSSYRPELHRPPTSALSRAPASGSSRIAARLEPTHFDNATSNKQRTHALCCRHERPKTALAGVKGIAFEASPFFWRNSVSR